MQKYILPFVFLLVVNFISCQGKKEIVQPDSTADIRFQFMVTDSNNVERNQFDSTEKIYVKYIIENLSDDTVEYKYAPSNLDNAVCFNIYHDDGVYVEIIAGVPPSSFIYTAYLSPHTSRIWQEVVKLKSGKYLATCSASLQFNYEKYSYDISSDSGHIPFTVL